MATSVKTRPSAKRGKTGSATLPGQVVLVLQGGGALGAYQVGVYEALHEAGIEPDWVIGTSIGAINAALIAGNAPEQRLSRLHEFWTRVEHGSAPGTAGFMQQRKALTNFATMMKGIPCFFTPNWPAWLNSSAKLGVENAAYYSSAPLRATLTDLVDLEHMSSRATRLTVGAVNVRSGEMRYFDSRDQALQLDHILASGALPPAFPAVCIDGEPYWDGGIYSNTPIEAVLDDHPRRDSLIFAVQMWNAEGPDPVTLLEVAARQKDIQFASRGDSHIARQQQIHHLRHIVREIAKHVPEKQRDSATVKELAAWGCGTVMHIVRLNAPKLSHDDHTKDIDFTPDGIEARMRAGYLDTQLMIARAPWKQPAEATEGVVIHDGDESSKAALQP